MSSIYNFLFSIVSILLKPNPRYSFRYIFDFLYFPTTITRLLKMNFNHVLYTFLVIFRLFNSFQQNGLLRNPTIELLRKEKQTPITHQLLHVHLKELTDTRSKHILDQIWLGSLITF